MKRICILLLLLAILPVKVQAAGPERILRICKTTPEEDGSLPLGSVVFDIYRGDGEVSRETLAATVVTDENGIAELNFTKAGLPDGVYLVTEQHNPATAAPGEPVTVTVPQTGENGYCQTLHLESIPEAAPDIRSDVGQLGRNSASFDLGEEHTWILRSDIPQGLVTAREYTITDVLNYRLTYVPGSPKVKLLTRQGIELLLTEGKHYTLTEGRQQEDGRDTAFFQISLTPQGMTHAAASLGTGAETPELRVYFRAAIHTNTAMGSAIPNDAHLRYVNSAGIVYQADSDIPEVHTGGLNLCCRDSQGEALAGVRLMLARAATQTELERQEVAKEVLDIGGKPEAVVYVSFYDTRDLTGEKTQSLVTKEDGSAALYGLAYGEYYLVEVYEEGRGTLLREPEPVQINETSHLTASDGWYDTAGNLVDNTLEISPRSFLPDTGGRGTAGYLLAGLSLWVWALGAWGWGRLTELLRNHRQQVPDR